MGETGREHQDGGGEVVEIKGEKRKREKEGGRKRERE